MNQNQLVIFVEDLESLVDEIAAQCPTGRIFILTDENVSGHCVERILPQLSELCECEIIEVASGEESKSLDICSHIYAQLIESAAGKGDLMLNIGGGMIGDLGGFVASTYKRGIPFMQIPTSLLAMTDAAIGGKNGIDHEGVKNVVGTITDPEATIIFPGFLETLPEKEFKSGFAEMLKHALIADKNLWQNLKSLHDINAENIQSYLPSSVEIKSAIVESDPFEKGERKKLNFGHTIGHAIESFYITSGNPVTHGECVALGMMVESAISTSIAQLQNVKRDEILHVLNSFFPIKNYNLPPFEQIEKFLINDKKNVGNELRMTLISDIGHSDYNIHVSTSDAKREYDLIRDSSQ